MSDRDSFIDEVSEEVRRDRLFGYFRRYGWIAVLVVVILVGGAAWNEWRKASDRSAAQARGDAILAALEPDEPRDRLANLSELDVDGDARALVALLASAEALAADDTSAAVGLLQPIADDAALPALYRDLATLKLTILRAPEIDPADRIATLEPLAVAGGPYRIVAEEQIALAQIEAGDTAAALDRLRALADDTQATAGLRRRVSQLIVALGGEPDPA